MAIISSDLYGSVVFDFQPSVPDELELRVGCVIKILREIDQFWYFGQNLFDGKSGQFPKDFINLITLPKAAPGQTYMFALDDFYPEVKDDLPFKKGDIIVMSHKVDESWGYGECKSKHGIFPLNYTQRLNTAMTASQPVTIDKSKYVCTVTATMPLSAQLDEELSFKIGDIISITEIMPDGWAVGCIGDQSGSFPLSFTSYKDNNQSEILSPNAAAAKSKIGNKYSKSNPVSQSDDALKTSSITPLESDYFKHLSFTEKPQPTPAHHEQPLRNTSASHITMQDPLERISESPLKAQSSTSSGSESGYGSYSRKDQVKENDSKSKPTKRFVIANFSHFGRNPDELCFKKGDVIEVLEVKSKMWLFGKLRGSTGYVPENYVSDYILSHNGHSELSNADTLFEKMKTIQQHGTSQQKEHAKQALVNAMCQHDDVRLVVQDFKATTDFELSVNVGDIVHVLQEINEKWSEVKNNRDQIGFIPNSCLEYVKTTVTVNQGAKPVASVQRSQTFVVKKAPRMDSGKEKLSRAISCQPAIPNEPTSTDKRQSPDSNLDEKAPAGSPSQSNSSSSLSDKNRRHSYHNRENSKQKAIVRNKSTVESRRSTKVSKVNPEQNSSSLATPNQSLSVTSSRTWENESSSVTSRDSVQSGNIPSSSCSTDSSESVTKRKSNSSRSSITDAETPSDHKTRRASRVAPPPPSAMRREKLPSNSEKPEVPQIQEHISPVRPPRPGPKLPVATQPEEIKLNSTERKAKVEKIRSEIEEYSRMQKDLEDNYNSTYDGKIRQEISEDKQFVVVKLKRLQKELHSLIAPDTVEPREDSELSTEKAVVDTTEISPESDVQEEVVLVSPEEEAANIKEKRLVKRDHVIRELIKTEEDYLQDVVITINDIMKPLIERELPLDIKLDIVFGNIEEIRDFSRKFLTSLKKTDRENNDKPVTVGSVFISHAPHMKEVYKIYCRNHDDSTALLEKYEDDPEFQTPVIEYLNHVKNKVNTFDLGSFLIKPVQRILKYPLLLKELLKLTDVPAPGEDKTEYDELIRAVKLLQEAANDINEDKRRKDLVRKYRKGSQDANLVEKFARISLHSVMKKSARISLRFGHVTGLNQPETVDETFNALEQRFKDLEKAIKTFLQNSDHFGNRYRDLLNLEKLFLEHVTDVWASDQASLVEKYSSAMRRTADHLYRQFHNRTQLEVHTPLNTLLVQFKGPQALIEKRFDKLLDYENCQKSSDPKDKTQMAKNVYEALNHQLIDELPMLCNLGYNLLNASINLFLHLQIRFYRSMLEVSEPVLHLCEEKLHSNLLDKKSIIERYNSAKNQVLVDMREFSVVPSSFTAVTSSILSSHASPGASRTVSQPVSSQQSQAFKEALHKRYKADDLFVATTNYKSDDKMSLSCSAGDLIGVIKRQDPLGSATRWFCDNGGSPGFLPSKILKSYSVQVKSPPTPKNTQTLSPASASLRRSAPVSRRRSPTSSSQSSGCSDPSSPLPSSAVNMSPNAVKYTKTICENNDSLEEDKSKLSMDPNKVRMKAFWDRKKLTDRQKYRLDYNFNAGSTLELSVRKGDLVELVEDHDMDGNVEWWLIANAEGKQGYVPANYMSKIEYL